jgi:hypothetical protein
MMQRREYVRSAILCIDIGYLVSEKMQKQCSILPADLGLRYFA